jgi:hypothetical protein
MKRVYFFIYFFVFSIATFAVSFKAVAPDVVTEGETFRLVYSVDERDAQDLRVPDMTDFEILAGPFTSRNQSMQIINGKMSSSYTESYTYTLIAKRVGQLKIPAASIVVDKQKYTSNAVSIQVLPAEDNANVGTNQRQQSSSSQSENRSSSNSFTSENIFIRAIPSKTKVMEQDYVLLTYKLYTVLDLVRITDATLPDFKGFLKQEIEQGDAQMKYENYKGKNYATLVLYQVLLYPQQSGDITVEKGDYSFLFRIRTQSNHGFFGFFDNYQHVEKKITFPSVKIHVDPLPNPKPTDFTGGVGNFTLSSYISEKKVATNDPITIRYTLKGNGNIKLTKLPNVEFPADFEVYDPKQDNVISNTTSGMSGEKSVEYLVIPRSAGDFTIPEMQFSYYDTRQNAYKTLTSPSYTIKVNPSNEGTQNGGVQTTFVNQEQLKVLGNDIRYIRPEEPIVLKKGEFFFQSFAYWASLIGMIILSILIFFFFRKHLKDSSDLIASKNKRANRLAIKRLKVAKKMMMMEDESRFYEETLKALWGFVGDKLNIPVAELSKDNIRDVFEQNAVDQSYIDSFFEIVSICEYAQYAPSMAGTSMQEVYAKAIEIITSFKAK